VSDFVLDASVTVAWCFGDEASEGTRALLRRLDRDQAVVPAIWPLEIANILAVAERRKRIAAADAAQFVSLLETLNIRIDAAAPERGLREILALARAEALSSYDAAYLDLALREGLDLATRDQPLRQAAGRLGVGLVALS